MRPSDSAQLAFELARDGQVARLAEEVLRVVDPAILRAGQVVQIERRYLEHAPAPSQSDAVMIGVWK